VQAGGKVRYSHAGQHLFEVQLPVGI
jgi:hypothetical protein